LNNKTRIKPARETVPGSIRGIIWLCNKNLNEAYNQIRAGKLNTEGLILMLVKVVAVQLKIGEKLSLEEKLFIFKQRPDFVCLPEYCFIDKSMPDFSRAALTTKDNLEYLQSLSDAFSTCLIGGSIVEADYDSLYNSSYIFNLGERAGRYRKLNPVSGEIEKGILPGDRIFTAIIGEVKIAVFICADALNIGLFDVIKNENVDLIFIPTTSPFRPDERKTEKHKRDKEIYLRAAQISGSYIIKTCGVGTLFGKPLQGRTLIVSPWGILKRVDIFSESSKCILSSILDIDEIRDFRRKKQAINIEKKKSWQLI